MKLSGLWNSLREEKPLQLVGTINAYTALLAQEAGFRAIYLSGAGVANASYGIPDLGLTTLDHVLDDASRIMDACDLPLLVDVDTGFGGLRQTKEVVSRLSKMGAAGIHIEDQVDLKRCGHRPHKVLVPIRKMQDRIKTALEAKQHASFVIMARTDALSVEGFDRTLERIHHYVDVGAEMIFFEGATSLQQYRDVTASINVPVLANMTEFGKTPLFTKTQLDNHGIQLILYPLSAFRTMSDAALKTYQTIRKKGTQRSLLTKMQTRKTLYRVLQYDQYEKMQDRYHAKGKKTWLKSKKQV